MNYKWISERVAVLDAETMLRGIILGEEADSWGPNDTFKYPLHGGTGYLCQALRRFVEGHLELDTRVLSVDPAEKRVLTSDGRLWSYDVLLSTMPLNHLVASMESAPDAVRQAAKSLQWTGSHIVGVGIDRPAMTTKNWIYFPELDVPFSRVTYLSNYSRYITPEPDQTLFLTETSHSNLKAEPVEQIVERVVDALVATPLMDEGDRDRIVTTWRCSPDMSYPVPSVTRDTSLGTIQPWLRGHAIWSRGRFGAWLYEVGNMDHSAMQGVEFVNHVLLGDPETVWIPRGQEASGEGIR
jgi:UDP-galactopyranose mutase